MQSDKGVVFSLLNLNRDDNVVSYYKHWVHGLDSLYENLDDLSQAIEQREPIFRQEGATPLRLQDMLDGTPDIHSIPLHYSWQPVLSRCISWQSTLPC